MAPKSKKNFPEMFSLKTWKSALKKFDLSTKLGNESMRSGNVETIQTSSKTNIVFVFAKNFAKRR